jgi:hypothetical protein
VLELRTATAAAASEVLIELRLGPPAAPRRAALEVAAVVVDVVLLGAPPALAPEVALLVRFRVV